MIDPSLPLQAALFTALDVTAVRAIIGNPARVFDNVPRNTDGSVAATFPYASFGPAQPVNDGNSCGEQTEVYQQLDLWSRAVGYVEVKRLGAAVCVALNAALTVAGFRVVVQHIEDVNYRREPDGLTSRGIVSLRVSLVPVP